MAPPPFKVKAVYDYHSEHDDDLKFAENQIITVTGEEDDDWYVGEYVDGTGHPQSGLFPKNFVERYEPVMPPRPARAKAPVEPKDSVSSAPAPAQAPAPVPVSLPGPPAADPSEQSATGPVESVASPSPMHRQESVDTVPSPTVASSVATPIPAPASASTPASAKSTEGAPPKKPSVGPKPSFLERIAAFNNPSAAPIAPVGKKPAVNPVVKRQFVALPQSRETASVLPGQPPGSIPTSTPAMASITAAGSAEISTPPPVPMVLPTEPTAEDGEAETSKPVSLKERIALLQQQQQQQHHMALRAGRHKTHESVDKKKTRRSVDTERPSLDELSTASPVPVPVTRASIDVLDDSDRVKPPSRTNTADISAEPEAGAGEAGDKDTNDEDDVDDTSNGEDDIDPEARRQMELRERMAKLSRGMGMAGMGMAMPGMFGIGGPATKKKAKPSSDQPAPVAAPVPIPGFGPVGFHDPGPAEAVSVPSRRTSVAPEAPPPVPMHHPDAPPVPVHRPEAAPPVPVHRPEAAPPVPVHRPEAAPPVPVHRPETAVLQSPSSGSVSDDEMTAPSTGTGMVKTEQLDRSADDGPASPVSPTGPAGLADDRSSERAGGKATAGIEQSLGALSMDERYDADCDTDRTKSGRPPVPPVPGSSSGIVPTAAPPAPPMPAAPPIPMAPPVPTNTAPPMPMLAGPPPVPKTAPPVPVAMPPMGLDVDSDDEDDGDADGEEDESDEYVEHKPDPRAAFTTSPPMAAPPPPPPLASVPPPLPAGPPPSAPKSLASHRMSMDPGAMRLSGEPATAHRKSFDPSSYGAPLRSMGPVPPIMTPEPGRVSTSIETPGRHGRKSSEAGRMSFDQPFLAHDLDLQPASLWWVQPNGMPPILQAHREDTLIEQRGPDSVVVGGRALLTKTVMVLYQDYSQTKILVQYDPTSGAEVVINQEHSPPPLPARPDMLESANDAIGSKIAKEAEAKQRAGAMVADGSPYGLPSELIRGVGPIALSPIGSRAFGMVVYTNMANSSVSQVDSIMPGDVITFRGAKFKVGTIHGKSSLDLGREHVGIVRSWDGTKKKVHMWEQGREKKGKVKEKSYRMGDLQTGEIKIWRVMPRSWVGW